MNDFDPTLPETLETPYALYRERINSSAVGAASPPSMKRPQQAA